MKYLLYSRVSPKGSSWDGNDTSCGDQLRQGREFVLARDPAATFVEVVDELFSAKDLRRPGIAKVIADLKAGKASWDVLVVRHLDRLTRSLSDALPLIDLLTKHGKGLVSVTQALDLSGPTGRAMLHMVLVFGQWEREMLSERVKGRLVGMAKQGQWCPGSAPYGYRRQGKGNNTLEIVPEQAAIVLDVFRSYASGTSINVLAKRHGFRHIQKVASMLRKRVYLGIVSYDGSEYPGIHEPIISQQEWDAAQARRPKRTSAGIEHPQKQQRLYLLSGMVRCSCGMAMTASTTKRKGRSYCYYRCQACKAMVSADSLEHETIEFLLRQTYESNDIDQVVAEIEKAVEQTRKRHDSEIRDIDRASAAARKTMDKFTDQVIDGVPQEMMAAIGARYATAKAEFERLSERRMLMEKRCEADRTTVKTAIGMARQMKDMASQIRRLKQLGDATKLREIIVSTISNLERQEDKSFILRPAVVSFVQVTAGNPNAIYTNNVFRLSPRIGWANRYCRRTKIERMSSEALDLQTAAIGHRD